jgi:LPXTG-site transpeptidase (sortase) family protein
MQTSSKPITRWWALLFIIAALLAGCAQPIVIQVSLAPVAKAAAPTAAIQPVLKPQPTPPPTATVPSPVTATATAPAPNLAVATRPPSRIVAPSIGLDSPIVPVNVLKDTKTGVLSWQTTDFAVGYHAGSAYPGQRGNTVLSGHHNIAGKVFEHLYELKEGDQLLLYDDQVAYRYVVTDSFIVPERGASDEQRQQNARWIMPTSDERVTLVTCWPATDNSHRVIVVAHPK